MRPACPAEHSLVSHMAVGLAHRSRETRVRKGTPRRSAPRGTAAVGFNPIAVGLAELAVRTGMAMEVVRLLTGGAAEGTTFDEKTWPGTAKISQEPRWDGNEREPGSSDHTKTESEDDGELSRLLKTVHERRTTQRPRGKPASS